MRIVSVEYFVFNNSFRRLDHKVFMRPYVQEQAPLRTVQITTNWTVNYVNYSLLHDLLTV